MITIAIWGDNRMLSIRCAKIKYGYNVIDDVLQGYSYQGNNGILLVRVSKGETSEDEQCEGDECEIPLFECNASEVTV